ncbi:MAG: hypothetical protein R2720_02140 [Candidatus Nanopelagicales bacterium]
MARRRPGVTGALFDELERWSGLGLGIAGLASGYTRSRMLESEDEVPEDGETVTLAHLMAVLPGATVTLAAAIQSRLFDLVAVLEDRINQASVAASNVEFTGRPIRAVHAWLTSLDQQFRDKQQQRASEAADFLARVGPETTSELLSRVDMNFVLSDVDVDALVDRVTLERVLEKVDVNTFMADVLNELDATGLLRGSTSVIASTTVDSIRSMPGTATRIAGRVVRRPT